MKLCKHCAHSEVLMLQGAVMVCNHSECVGPVLGEPMPCLHARISRDHCGIRAKFFLERKGDIEDAEIIESQKREYLRSPKIEIAS